MKNLFSNIIAKRRGIVLVEEELSKAIDSINQCRKIRKNVIIQKCGWEGSNKWYIQFKMRKNQWLQFNARLRANNLNDVETFSNGNFRP